MGLLPAHAREESMSSAVTETAPKVSKSGKVRTRVNGKIAWVWPDELPLANPQAAAAASVTAPALGWDGEALPAFDEDYEDYLNSRPSREELRPYPTPVHYWEPTLPGCALQPYPRMGAFTSTVTGRWTANNAAQERAIRSHLAKECQVDPDLLKLSEREWDVMNGRAATPPVRYCHEGGCRWVSCSPLANDIHEKMRGHTTKATPREN